MACLLLLSIPGPGSEKAKELYKCHAETLDWLRATASATAQTSRCEQPKRACESEEGSPNPTTALLDAMALLLWCLVVLLLLGSCSPSRELRLVSSSAYEEMESFGFPAGLLPHRVVNYVLERPSGGKFSLQLDGACSAMLQGTYLITYGSNISGVVSYGAIRRLKGVSVRAFYVDWTITGIRVQREEIIFEVGIASAKFPVSNFDDSPQCSGGSSSGSSGSSSSSTSSS